MFIIFKWEVFAKKDVFISLETETVLAAYPECMNGNWENLNVFNIDCMRYTNLEVDYDIILPSETILVLAKLGFVSDFVK